MHASHNCPTLIGNVAATLHQAGLRVCGEGRSSAFRRRPGCGLASKVGPHADTLSSSSRARAGARELKITISCFGRPSELMANAVRSPRRLSRPYETHTSTNTARARARCASFVAHITWICRACTGVQDSPSTGDAPRSRYGSSKREGAAVAARLSGRHPSRRPRPRDRIQLTCAAPRVRVCAGIIAA